MWSAGRNNLCLWHTAPATKLFQAVPLGKSTGEGLQGRGKTTSVIGLLKDIKHRSKPEIRFYLRAKI